MGIQKLLSLIVIGSVAVVMSAAVGHARSTHQAEAADAPAFIEADNMAYDRDNGIIRAEGHVEIIQGGRMLLADKVVYDQKKKQVNAYGDISLLETDGTIVFAEEAELRDGLKQGVIEHFSARMQGSSLFVADSAIKESESRTKLERAVYSPCPVCKEEPESNPMWQIKSRYVTIDQEEQRVEHNHTFFEVYGVPVFYTPYLSHATPGADRKSGFLIPSYGSRSGLGEFIKIPYYYNIAPERDATVTMQYFTDVDPVMFGEYRALTETGSYEVKGSITRSDKFDDLGNVENGQEARGHIQAEGKFNLEDNWSWGFEARRSTDDTYLRRYGIYNADSLTSHLYSQKIEGNNFASIEALSFQGLNRDDDPDSTPLVLPFAQMHVESKPGLWNSYTTLDANMLSLYRQEGTRTGRLSTKASWILPDVTPSGHVFEYKLSLRGDGYVVKDLDRSDVGKSEYDGFAGRIVPQAEMNWRYPMMKPTSFGRAYIEPIANFIVSPSDNNSDDIPNEDSQEVEFSDENLFSDNHYIGYDLVEGGARTNYGVRSSLHTNGYGHINSLFGQTYRAERDENFSASSGLQENFSDYVGQVGYRMKNYLKTYYSFRLDKDNFKVAKNELFASVNVAPVSFSANYLSLEDNNRFTSANTSQEKAQEILTTNSRLQLSKLWDVGFRTHRDMASEQWISYSSDLTYDGECILAMLSWKKDFTQNRDVPQADTFLLKLLLKEF